MSTLPRLAAVGTLLLLLSGCALISAPPPPQPQSEDSAPDVEPEVTEEETPAGPAFGADYAAVDPASLAAPDQDGLSWVSPSRNLMCGILEESQGGTLGEWGCTIGEKNWTFPSDSPDDYCYDAQTSCGWGIVGFADEVPNPRYNGGMLFSSEMDQGEYPVLAYGQSVTYLGVTCISSEDGIQCQHLTTGHGFLISRSDNLIY